jgi:hypothetical protein
MSCAEYQPLERNFSQICFFEKKITKISSETTHRSDIMHATENPNRICVGLTIEISNSKYAHIKYLSAIIMQKSFPLLKDISTVSAIIMQKPTGVLGDTYCER